MAKGQEIETKWCKQCKTDRPATEFMKPRRKGWRVTICNACAQENMRRYDATSRRDLTDIDKIKDGD